MKKLISPCQSVDLPNVTITCFLQKGFTLYPDITSTCDVIKQTAPSAQISIADRVYPNPSNGQRKIILEPLPAGIYILTISDNEKNPTNMKVAIIN